MTAILLVISTIILLIAPISYAISIVRGSTRPHRLTRLAVMAGLLLTFASAVAAHANSGTLLLTGISAAHGVLIFALSMWRGMGGGKNRLDWTCFLIAIAGLLMWQLSGKALVGMYFAIFADLVAYLPTFAKTWHHPGTENHWFYTLSAVGALLTLAAYPLQTTSVFQIYIMASSLLMVALISRRRLGHMLACITHAAAGHQEIA